jgi:hypothetical protein
MRSGDVAYFSKNLPPAVRGLLATDPVGVRARVLLAPWRAAGGSFELRVPTIAIVLGRQVDSGVVRQL